MMLYSAMSAAQFESFKAEHANVFGEPGWRLPVKKIFVNAFQATQHFKLITLAGSTSTRTL